MDRDRKKREETKRYIEREREREKNKKERRKDIERVSEKREEEERTGPRELPWLTVCNSKGFRAIKRGPVPVTGPSVSLTGPSVPPTLRSSRTPTRAQNPETTKSLKKVSREEFGILEVQQFTCGVVSEGFFAESLRNFCGKFAEFCKEMRVIAPGQGTESLRKFRGNLQKSFLQWPLPERPHKRIVEKWRK